MRPTTPGKLPAFVASLLSEGWLAQVLHEREARDAIRRGKRFMSSAAIVTDKKELETLPLTVMDVDCVVDGFLKLNRLREAE